ncbi:hypothetical protein DY000_02031182 [Brassica cretica]|uniref:Uncharacterized protein n=1 Tax=Brassica cretica TaxID=69181 RepID=A0ABQ7E1F8_BRACR|nr:hypothetical protein DY000_02031182 [Brassica cretica]
MFPQASATSRNAEDWFRFRMPRFVLEMFAGLKMLCGVRTEGSRKFVPEKRHPPILCFVRQIADYRLAVRLLERWSLNWFCMKVVLSFIAKDVVGKGLNHGTFVLIPKPCQVSRSFHVLRWPMGVENDLCFRETKPKSLDPEPVQSLSRLFPARIYLREVKRRSQRSTMIVNRKCQSSDVSADFTGRVSALISIFGEISLDLLMEFYQGSSRLSLIVDF